MNLTDAQMKFLESASQNDALRIDGPRGLRRAAKERMVNRLCVMGLVIPNAHGDWYITPAGRAALASLECPTPRPSERELQK